MSLKKVTLEELAKAVKESFNAAEAARKLNLTDAGSTTTRIRKLAISNGLDITHWTGRLWAKGKTTLDDPRIRKQKSTEEIFALNSNASPAYVRKLILNKNLLEHICQVCKNGPTWESKPLTLQLDHINGDRKDHRLENLRWICPNCHSQTDTYGGKNSAHSSTKKVSDEELLTALKNSDSIRQALVKVGLENGRNYKRAKRLAEKYGGLVKLINTRVSNTRAERFEGLTPSPATKLSVVYKKCICGKDILNKNFKHCSYDCAHKAQRKIDWDSLDLKQLTQEMSVVQLAKKLGCSDNAIHKRMSKLGLK